MELGLLGALAGGVLTLLSPCSVMLLPAFFSYAFSSPAKLLARTGVFYLGLITTLVPLGVLAGTVGAFVTAHRLTLVAVLSAVVIALGVLMVLDVPLPSPPSRRRTGGVDSGAPGAPGAGGAADGTSALAVYVLGTVYGLAGVCAGPLLGAALTVAAMSASALYGGLVLLVFAAGMALPLVLLAALWRRLPAIQRLVRPRMVRLGPVTTTVTGIVGGLLTCALGVLMLVTGGTSSLGGLLGASKQVELEAAVRLATQAVPDWAVLVAVAAVAGIAWRVSRARARTP
ncbi:cytochrome c biogenesis CcdA family protein, partial [Schaalia naturae]|uniref:Cytochrome c biogenesis CcdA family protein n=1 Tax=Schaalia naturae TaxID=635203 RepID=A0ABW2SNB2_9ACTO